MDWYVGSEWKIERKGLRKKVLDLKFKKLEKPSEIAKVIINVKEVHQLNVRPSSLLNFLKIGEEQFIQLGTALTPVDCYVEEILRQMMVGETAQCFLKTKSADEEISFIITLQQIIESKELFQLSVREMYHLAQLYRENGVAMFKDYPIFAHAYFARAAKFLISYKPFDDLTDANDGVDGKDMQALFITLQTNLAACLLQQERYEHVLYQTKFVETALNPSEKSCYRRALAYYNMKEFEAALGTIEKVPNYMEKKEFTKLHANIVESRKKSDDQYKNVVQRMFHK